MSVGEGSIETTMPKADLLKILGKKLVSLKKQRTKDAGAYQRALRIYVRDTVAALRWGAVQVKTGHIKPGARGRWCDLREQIERRIGDVPDSLEELDKQIAGYEAAIVQIKYHRGDPLRVSTHQVREWLAGKEVRRG